MIDCKSGVESRECFQLGPSWLLGAQNIKTETGEILAEGERTGNDFCMNTEYPEKQRVFG